MDSSDISFSLKSVTWFESYYGREQIHGHDGLYHKPKI